MGLHIPGSMCVGVLLLLCCSAVEMTHGPINIRFTSVYVYAGVLNYETLDYASILLVSGTHMFFITYSTCLCMCGTIG